VDRRREGRSEGSATDDRREQGERTNVVRDAIFEVGDR
jgi:hypothetical protein